MRSSDNLLSVPRICTKYCSEKKILNFEEIFQMFVHLSFTTQTRPGFLHTDTSSTLITFHRVTSPLSSL